MRTLEEVVSTATRAAAFPGYVVTAEIHRGARTLVQRAIRERDQVPVILKSLLDEFPTARQNAGMRREYELLAELGVPGIPPVYALESHRGRLALVLADRGGATLKSLIAGGAIDLPRFFDLAIELAAIVARVHARNIIHKDINPTNVLVDLDAGRVLLIDFGIASRLATEPQRHLLHPHLLEGTIAYMSPEQTGRMNRDIDYRSDLYSLGVTLYEMLTGRVPFESGDALEVIHGHVARTPATPHALEPSVPVVLSELVMRLLAKSAEDRYQSAEGVVADLGRCRSAWQTTQTVAPFPLGQADVRGRFVIPQRLYGREAEAARLLEAFDRVAAGRRELVLVSGYSGIGKSSLIQEIYRSLASRPGHFISGKFDQLARDIPYSALAQAFQALIRHVLAGSDEQVAEWRQRVLAAVGPHGQVILDVIPDLERLVGPQPAVPPLGAAESQNRFNRVFQAFLRAVAGPEHPLVLFLDDLQWADGATLTLLPLFLGNPEITGLLVIGAYRDNELTPAHPLHHVLEDLRNDSKVTRLSLPPLGLRQLVALVRDTIGGDPHELSQLGDLVLEKTGGNPFFVIQFLKALHQDGHIGFDAAAGGWRADLAAIRTLRVTENVVDLMAARILRLGETTQRVLRLAACVGSRFDLETLATVNEAGVQETARELWPAIEQGLILPDDLSYGFAPDTDDGVAPDQRRFRFLHDRVQQAAYALIPEAARREVHLAIGRLLLARTGGTPAESIFDVVNQLNYGAELISDPAERLRLAELNLLAGRKAKRSAAFPSALGYFTAGGELLPADAWASHAELTFGLSLERAEAQFLTGRLDEAERSYAALLDHAADALDKVEVYALMVSHYETTARYQDAVRAALAGLRLCGIDLPEDRVGQRAALAADLGAVQQFLQGRPVSVLLDLPLVRSRAMRKAIKLLMTLWAPAFISGETDLSDLAGARMVRLSIEHGHCEESAYGYVAFAMTVGWRLGDYAQGYDYGQLAIALNERLADLRLRAKVHHRFAALVNLWRRPFATCIPHAREAVRAGLEAGDFMIAGYGQFQQSWWGMHIEPDLAGFGEKYQPNVDFLGRMRLLAYREVQKMILHWALALRGLTASPTSLSSADFDEQAYLATFGHRGLFGSWYVTLKLELLHTFGQVEAARFAAREWEPVAEVFASSIWPAMFAFRHLLAICAWLPTAPSAERSAALAKLDQLQDRLRVWAENAPENFRHLYLLAIAEVRRVRGETGPALEAYEGALAAAESQPSPRYRALVNELYGEFWVERGRPTVAAAYLREALYAYHQWGAQAKVAQLEQRHAALLARAPQADHEPPLLAALTTQTQESVLDLHTVIKVAQALAGEIDLERLLRRLMQVAIEHAGAERGCFIVEQDGVAAVPVSGRADLVEVHGDRALPLEQATDVAVGIANLVRRTRETVAIDDAREDAQVASDPYVARQRPRSIICTPVVNQGRLLGALYLENNLAAGVFTADRAQVLQIIAAQAGIAIENAHLFAEIRRLKDRLQAENVYLIEEIKTQQGFEEIVGHTAVLKRVLSRIEQVADTDTTVLVTGETGTGKELVARAIHAHSRRRERPMVCVNCGAIAPGLVESELFGHEKGAFTGALSRKIGRFELADGGTVFLDEIGDLPLDLQVKLLRVLQEGEIERVGGTRVIKVDVRVIAATHRDLARAVEEGRFRADLYYRLNVFPVPVPPLRDRKEDIPVLVRHFVLKYATRDGKRIEVIPKHTLDALAGYAWPGNVRELANVIERSVIVSRGPTLELGDWIAPQGATPPESVGLATLEDVERAHILATLQATSWRVSGPAGAATRLGLKPTTLEARMKKLGIRRPR